MHTALAWRRQLHPEPVMLMYLADLLRPEEVLRQRCRAKPGCEAVHKQNAKPCSSMQYHAQWYTVPMQCQAQSSLSDNALPSTYVVTALPVP
jgi:hypothetical protein